MALAAATIWEVEAGGSDTLNGGAFDPGQTAGMNTDGAATSATGASPVFSSASYNFAAGDVGAWVFIASGTNWIPGWYKIASVASNVATLSAAIGAAVVFPGGTVPSNGLAPSTVQGCATTGSPTGATWSIDYSQQASARYAYTDLASVGAGLLVSSAANPFGKEQVGNAIVITGGTNFTTGRYVIASVAAAVATVVGPGNITTGAGVSGTGGQGGALASHGKLGAHMVGSNQSFVKTATYTVTSASANVAGGCLSLSISSAVLEGYDTVRGDLNPVAAPGTRPTIVASGISTFTLISNTGGAFGSFRNLILDGASLTASQGIAAQAGVCHNIRGQNFTNSAFASTALAIRCRATGCSTQPAFASTAFALYCIADANTVTGFSGPLYVQFCLAYNNTGGSSDGFASAGTVAQFLNCTSYGNGRDGYRFTGIDIVAVNCAAENNSGVGFTFTPGTGYMLNCAAYNNSGGAKTTTTAVHILDLGFVTGTAEFFTDAGSGDFSLNATAGGGAALRAAGYPGAFPGGLAVGALDIGAVQHAVSRLPQSFIGI